MAAPQSLSSPADLALAHTAHLLPAPKRPRRESAPERIRRLVVDVLPLILLALLAAGTTWLVRNSPQEELAHPAPPASEPDSYMRHFRVRSYSPSGQLLTELQGRFADHIPANDTLRIQAMRGYSYNPDTGVTLTAQAARAITDSKGANAELFDQVKVLRQQTAPATDAAASAPHPPRPAARNTQPQLFESNYLRIVNRQDHIYSNQPVRITQGSDVITGTGLDYTGGNTTVRLNGRVRATIRPSH